MPQEAFLLVHAGMRRECEKHGEVRITKSTMTVLKEPTRWVLFKHLQKGLRVWDWRQRSWVPVVSIDRSEGTMIVEGRRRRIGEFERDEKVAVLVDPEEMTPEARAAYEAARA